MDELQHDYICILGAASFSPCGSRSLAFGAMSCGLFDPLTMAPGMALCVTDGDPSHRARAWVRVCV